MKKIVLVAFLMSLSASTLAYVCPSVTSLTTTCGNGSIEAGETKDNCPEDTVDQNTRALGYYAQLQQCKNNSDIYKPSNIQEMQEAVATLVSQGKNVKVKGTGHSTTGMFCTTDNGGVIYTESLKGISGIEQFNGKDSVVIEAGVTYNDLIPHLTANGKSLGYTVTGVGMINVIGTINTGVHGSARSVTSSISSRVLEIDLIKPDGTIVTYNESNTTDEEWKYLRTPLGSAGAIARARLEVEDNIGMYGDVQVNPYSDLLSVDALRNNVFNENKTNKCDYSFSFAYPIDGKVVTYCGTERPISDVTDPTVQTTFFDPDVLDIEDGLFLPIAQSAVCDQTFANLVASQQITRFTESVNAKYVGGSSSKTRIGAATGYINRMNQLDRFEAKASKFSAMDYEVVLKLEDVPAFMQKAKEVYEAHNRNPFMGLVIRRDIVEDDTIMGGNAVREGLEVGDEIVHIEIPSYYPFEASDELLADYLGPNNEIFTWAVETYSYAHLHWGKNPEALFELQRDSGNVTDRMHRFQTMVNKFDPYGIYKNDILEKIGVTWPQDGENFAQVYTNTATSSVYTQEVTLYHVKSKRDGKCLSFIGSDNPLSSDEVFGMNPAEVRDCNAADYKQQMFVWNKGTGLYTDNLYNNMTMRLYTLANPFYTRLEHIWGSDYRFNEKASGRNQKFWLQSKGNGDWWIKSQVKFDSTPCMSNLAGSNAVSGEACWNINGNRLKWKFENIAEKRIPLHAGYGGDANFIEKVGLSGVDMKILPSYNESYLNSIIDNSYYKAMLVQVFSSNGTPMQGIEACLDGWESYYGVDGRKLACGYSDSNGEIMFIGLPYWTTIDHIKPRLGEVQ